MDYTEKQLSREVLYEGRIIKVYKDGVRLPNGHESIREIVDHPGGVAIVPLDAEGNIYCVRQYRYAYRTMLLETPAGKLEPGEEPMDCAVRELGEETGFTADRYTYLGELYPSPGYCRESLYIYLAEGLHRGAQHLDADEFLSVERRPLAELVRMVMEGEIPDAKTVVAVLKTDRLLRERRKES